jgi:hypothetical protein
MISMAKEKSSSFLYISVLENETTTLCRNVGNKLSNDAKLHPRRKEASNVKVIMFIV